jgi:hypothetical protein
MARRENIAPVGRSGLALLPSRYGRSPSRASICRATDRISVTPSGVWRAIASKILESAEPATIPVEQPSTVRLVANLRATDALGPTVPSPVRLRPAGDRVDPIAGSLTVAGRRLRWLFGECVLPAFP